MRSVSHSPSRWLLLVAFYLALSAYKTHWHLYHYIHRFIHFENCLCNILDYFLKIELIFFLFVVIRAPWWFAQVNCHWKRVQENIESTLYFRTFLPETIYYFLLFIQHETEHNNYNIVYLMSTITFTEK